MLWDAMCQYDWRGRSFAISWSFTRCNLLKLIRSHSVRPRRWDVWEPSDPRDPSRHWPSGFGAAGPVCLHSRDCGRGRKCAGRLDLLRFTYTTAKPLFSFFFIWHKKINRLCVSTCCRHCSQQQACCSSMGCGTPAVSSSSASWTPQTAWASEASLTHTPAATCSSQHTSMSCSTLWRCPRLRSSCCCHWNR